MAGIPLMLRSSRRQPVLSERPPRRSGHPRRAWRILSVLLILVGSLALIDAGVTLVWQEPISAIYAKLKQDRLSGALAKVERAPLTQPERRALASLSDERARIAFLAHELQHRAAAGSAVGRIRIPRIGVSFVVVKGTDTSELKSGPGIYSGTGFPGSAETTAIAGHRTTYLAPFRHIDALRAGSWIMLEMPYAHFTYVVIGQRVVVPTDVRAAVAEVGYNRLVLSACTPLFSAAQRLLVFAHLIRTVPVGVARLLPSGALARPIEAPRAHRRRRAPLPAVLEPLQPLLPPAVS